MHSASWGGWPIWEVRSKALRAKTESLAIAAQSSALFSRNAVIARKKGHENWTVVGTRAASATRARISLPFGVAVPHAMLTMRAASSGRSREPSLKDYSVVGLARDQVVSRTTLPSESIFTVGAGASRQAAPLMHSPLRISNR